MTEDRLTSRQRMRALFLGEPLDRVPCVPFAMAFAAKVAGISIKDFYTAAEACYAGQARAAQMLGYEGSPNYGFASFGGGEFGGEVMNPEDERLQAPMVMKPGLDTLEKVERLKVPDPRTAGTIPMMLEFAHLCRKNKTGISVQCGTPFTVAGNAMGVENLMLWLIDTPDLVHAALKKIAEFCIRVVELFAGEFGAGSLMAAFGSTMDSNMLISGEQFEEFSLPYAQQVADAVRAMGVRSISAHLCGDHNLNLPRWAKVDFGKPGFLSLGSQTSLPTAVRLLGERNILAGNLDTAEVMQGTPERVKELSRIAIEQGMKSARGFVLMCGCEVPPPTPRENILAMVEACREYGRYA
ncbi:MAG: uroporphyrinogen decarboxylase family protein [Candidatus Tectomicrobia bacterium]|nr:uroporphyrinogen decarboxylase family protein [Candidatus Tectomicrobia bacterium]